MLQRLDLNGTWKVLAWGVCLDGDSERALPDDFFDVFPGQEMRLPWTDPRPPQVLFAGDLA